MENIEHIIFVDIKRTGYSLIDESDRIILRRILSNFAKYNMDIQYC